MLPFECPHFDTMMNWCKTDGKRQAEVVEPPIGVIKEVINMSRGRKQGSCGGTPRRDGSGKGKGNRGTKRQPK